MCVCVYIYTYVYIYVRIYIVSAVEKIKWGKVTRECEDDCFKWDSQVSPH